jgi:iron(III) transport system substrate-binding protein
MLTWVINIRTDSALMGCRNGPSSPSRALNPLMEDQGMQATLAARGSVRILAQISLVVAAVVVLGSAAWAQGEVNIYSYREPGLIDPLLKAFTAKTGIKTNVVFANAGLNERLAAEGKNSPADVLLTTDAGRLSEAKQMGLTQAVDSPLLQQIPAHFRDADNNWFGLTMRGRVVYVSKDRVKLDSITYEDLADPKWKGKICIRSGQHAYNTSLVATLIAHKGEAFALEWVKGVKANLAQKPAGGDREQVRDVRNGKCDLAIGNTYYMALMMTNEKNPEQKEWASAVKILFPNANDRGTHVNISGIALAKNAPHRDNGVKLMEYLASDEAQQIYASSNNEYPVNPHVAPSAIVQGWGTLKADTLPLENIGKYRKRASELMDQVNFDAGPSS